MTLFRQIFAMLKKELLTEWRMKSRVSGIFWFAFAVVLMVAVSIPDTSSLPKVAGGTLWIGLMLASTRSLDQSYAVENEHGALEGLLLWPVEPIAIYYGKAIANAVILILVALALLPLLIAIFNTNVRGNPAQLCLIVVFGCAALAAPGTLFGLITSQARGSSVLLPLLLFPLVVPALLAAANATSKVFEGDPMNQVPSWLGLLVAYDVFHWSIMGLLYGWVLED